MCEKNRKLRFLCSLMEVEWVKSIRNIFLIQNNKRIKYTTSHTKKHIQIHTQTHSQKRDPKQSQQQNIKNKTELRKMRETKKKTKHKKGFTNQHKVKFLKK